MSTAQTAEDTSLKKGRLGVLGIVFFVVAASAPLVGMTGAVPVAMLAGNGAAAPGAYLAVGIVLLLFSVGYTAMAHKVTNTGAFFAYVGRGLGIKAGVASAFISIVGYVTIQLAIYGFFGAILSGQMAALGLELPWYVWSILAWALVTALSLLSVDVGAKVLGTLMILELLSLIITAIAILANGGPEGWNIGASFAPDQIFAGGFGGGAGIAIAFAFASFIGFEATAIYGEESVDPKKTVRRATYWAIGIITALFAVVSFAMVTGMGANAIFDQVIERSSIEGVPLADPAAVLFSLTDQYVGGWMVTIMSWLVVSSLFAGLLAFQNATARYFFAMGRGGILSERFAHVNKAGAPRAGVILTSIIALVVIVIFAVAQLDPVLNLFFWMSAITAISIILVEILVSVAVIAYFAKNSGANAWQGKIAPALAAIGLVLGEYLLMSRFNLLAGTVADGVDPSLPESAWALSPLGWFLVLLPFIAGIIGFIVAAVQGKEKAALTEDILS
ncbi:MULTISPECIES: APC family permease [Aurantimicrobium]|uniref:Putrescine importer PuuP n=1 Tax=Aurantimicrobium photophilum TaxID=1987356 RepID=A0A2Z3S563_9MICO|nr:MULTISPECIES: APC family permease [Aurantimicrobium]AWR22143.1 Putrescine importer PuuP [Aurantimicrobium photophilum]